MGNAPESMIDPNGESVGMSFSSPQAALNFVSAMNRMFGADNWGTGDNGEVVFRNLWAAQLSFEKFMASGQGGGCFSTGETMAFIGKQILAAHNSQTNNIIVGWENNDMTFGYGRFDLAEAQIVDKKMTEGERVFSILAHKRERRVSKFDGFLGQINHLRTGGNINGIRYDDDGYPVGLSPMGGTAPTEGSLSGLNLLKLRSLFSAGESALSAAEILRIENAATKIGQPINVVGSRANGTAKAFSDWDYVIEGLNSRGWDKIKNSLPGAKSVLDNTPRVIDIFKGPLDKTKPFITIYPRP